MSVFSGQQRWQHFSSHLLLLQRRQLVGSELYNFLICRLQTKCCDESATHKWRLDIQLCVTTIQFLSRYRVDRIGLITSNKTFTVDIVTNKFK